VEDATAVTFTGSTFSTTVDAGIASGNGTSGFLDGLIAEVAVTTAVATPQQIAELYRLAKALIPAPQPGGNGNQTDDGTRLNDWDALNRLKLVRRKFDFAIIGQYTYDALGRRIRKVISNNGLSGNITDGTTDYLYSSGGVQCCEERDGSDVAQKQYLWGRYIDELIQMRTDVSGTPADRYLLSDLLYRARALTDSSGNIVEAYDTDAYGNTLIFSAAGSGSNWWADDATQSDEPICNRIFCGYYYDPETETYYVNARYYTPEWARFTGRDSLFRLVSQYSYVNSRPTTIIDPSGHIPVDLGNSPHAAQMLKLSDIPPITSNASGETNTSLRLPTTGHLGNNGSSNIDPFAFDDFDFMAVTQMDTAIAIMEEVNCCNNVAATAFLDMPFDNSCDKQLVPCHW